MSRWLMIDTNTFSYAVNASSTAAREKLDAACIQGIACVSAVTEAEIRYWLAKKPAAIQLRSAVEALLQSVHILPWTSIEARTYGTLRSELERSGRTLASLDMLIAAHAISVGAVLVTRDKAFSNVGEALATENWATDL